MTDLDMEVTKMAGTRTVAAMLAAVASFAAVASCQTSDWIEVTPQNGVWDEYYRRTADPANCSFRFRVSRYADSLGVEAYVRDDRVVVDDSPAGSISCETWKDETSLAYHSSTDAFKKYVGIIGECGEMKVEKFVC